MKKTFALLLCIYGTSAISQNVAINSTGAAPAASAMLDVSSTTSGLLIPRMTTAQRTAIASPATSVLVFDTSLNAYYYYDGTAWVPLLSSSSGWMLTGNTLAGTEYMGSNNAQPVRFVTAGVERIRILSGGQVGVNTTAPNAGDNVAIYSTATNNWALNCYNSQASGSGVYVNNSGVGTTYSALESNQASSSGGGVFGISAGTTGGTGVIGYYNGTSANGIGILGRYNGTGGTGIRIGVRGYSGQGLGNQQVGVYGDYNGAAWGVGVVGIGFGGGVPAGNNDIAVVGWRSNNSNYSGYFNGNHVIANGTKSGSVPTSKGNQLLYVTETPEVWFEDIGGGKLVNGQATVNLDPLFLETVVIDDKHPMHVFIQMEGESNEVYVIKDKTSFTVKERGNGTSDAAFSYRIMAKRVHFQDHRFGNDPVWGPGDTRQYSQYAPPPPVDYYENVRFQEEQKKNWKPTPMPEGFIYGDQWRKIIGDNNAYKGQQQQPKEEKH